MNTVLPRESLWKAGGQPPFPCSPTPHKCAKLQSWTDDAKTRFYSGQAIYEKDFAVPGSQSGSRAYLEFGPGAEIQPPPHGLPHFQALFESPVREVGQVFINGQSIGWLWKPPYRLDATSSIRIGQNHLKIIVYNLAINALAGRALPDYTLLTSLCAQRFKPQDMKRLEPLPSGSLAAPRLVVRREK